MLEIENLRFGYSGIAGEAPLLHVEKFQLKDNEHLLIQGNSGSGKTSLLFLLGGLLLPNAGEIRLNGTNFAALSNSARDAYRGRHIGFVFQQPHLMAPLSVLDNVLVAPFMGSVPVEKT